MSSAGEASGPKGDERPKAKASGAADAIPKSVDGKSKSSGPSLPVVVFGLVVVIGLGGLMLKDSKVVGQIMGKKTPKMNSRMKAKFQMMQEQMEEMGKLHDQTSQRPNPPQAPEPESADVGADDDDEEPPPSCSGGHDGSGPMDFSKKPESCGGPPPSDTTEDQGNVAEDDEEDNLVRRIISLYPTIFGANSRAVDIKDQTDEEFRVKGSKTVRYTRAAADISEANGSTGSHRIGIVECAHPDQSRFLVSHYGYLQSSPAAEPDLGTPENPLRIMSLNVWNYNLFGARLGLMKAAMEGIDIIGLQEVRSKLWTHGKLPSPEGLNLPGSHLFQSLAMSELRPDMEFVYEPAQMFEEKSQGPFHTVHEGVGAMSRFRILESNAVRLTLDPHDGSDYHQRLCLHVVIQLPGRAGRRLHFLTTHLSLSEKARVRTLQEIVDYAKTLEGPIVLTGDFNNPIGSKAHRIDPTAILSQAGFKDGFLEAGYGGPGQRGLTFPSWNPIKRIDAVYVRGLVVSEFELRGSRHIKCDEGLESAGDMCRYRSRNLWVSDHLFPVAHLVFPKDY